MMKDIFNEMLSPSGAEVSIIPVMQADGVMQIDENGILPSFSMTSVLIAISATARFVLPNGSSKSPLSK